MAVAEVVLEVLPQPPPREPAGALRVLAVPRVVRVVQYLYLASTWVACAGVAAWTVARRALGVDSPVPYAFLEVSMGCLAVPALIIVVVTLQLSRAMCAAGFRSSLRNSTKEIQFQIQSGKMFGGLTWKVLRNPVLVMLVTFLLLLLAVAGDLVLEGLLPVEESQREKIGYALFDTGALGAMAMFCFVIIPSCALKVWRSK